MVKINTKKEMNLIELINWAFKNDVHCNSYITSDEDGNVSEVTFDACGIPRFSSMVSKEDTFTVEVEEEITGDTKLSSVLEMYKDIHYPEEIFSTIQKDVCINNIINSNPDFFITKYLYLINEDKPPTLIWKDGELVGDE